MNRPWNYLPVALMASCWLGSGCAGKSAPAPVVNEEAARAGTNTLTAISVEDRGANTAIMIGAEQSLSPNIFKLTDPDRIIIDLTDTKLGTVTGPIAVNGGGITEISANQFDDAASSLSRVVVGLSEALEYQVSTEGTNLVLAVTKAGGAAAPAEAGLPAIPEVAHSDPLSTPPAEIPSSEPPPAVAEAPKSAAELVDVQYSSGDSGTSVRLIGDAPIDSFEDRVLENPWRIVVDLKGLKNAFPGGKKIELRTKELSGLRLGADSNRLRVVMDAQSADKPLYTIERDGAALVVNVAVTAAAEPEPDSSAEPLAAAEPPPEAAVPTPEVAIAAEPERVASPIHVTGIAFKQLKELNRSRLVVTLSEATNDYLVRDSGPNSFVVEIPNSRLDKGAMRGINTSEFKTAIVRVTPTFDKRTKSSALTVDLGQQVPYHVTLEGNALHVDVDIPPQIARKQEATPSVAKEASLPPSEEPQPAAASEEKSGAQVDISALREEKLLTAEEVTPASATPSAADGRPKNYRYVRESFMSDSFTGSEPLSDMGSILAGEFRGRKFTGRRISLDFKDAEIRSIFRLIADISKLNMIISDEVGGRVTVRLENVPWDQAFAIILQTKGLWFEKYGNILRIAPADKLRAEKELAAAAEKAAMAAKPLDVLFKPVSYATAGSMTSQVRSVLSDRGSIDIDSRTNTLIIKDVRENLEKAKRMVDILDTQTPQVTIESRIVEANTNYTRSFGIIWGGQARFTAATGNPTGVFFPNTAAIQGIGAGAGTTTFSGLPVALNYPSPLGTNAGVGIRLGSINNILDLDLTLGLLETKGQAKLISSPKMTVLDNESATISAGSKIPFITQTSNAGSNVRFESATTSLNVSPHVANDGAILLNVSVTRNEPNFGQVVQGNPLVDTRSADTKVLVKSGNTTVIGGIYSIRTGGSEDSLPYVSKIPIIGWLFKNYAKELRRQELLIFITPRIVGDEREAVRDVRG